MPFFSPWRCLLNEMEIFSTVTAHSHYMSCTQPFLWMSFGAVPEWLYHCSSENSTLTVQAQGFEPTFSRMHCLVHTILDESFNLYKYFQLFSLDTLKLKSLLVLLRTFLTACLIWRKLWNSDIFLLDRKTWFMIISTSKVKVKNKIRISFPLM